MPRDPLLSEADVAAGLARLPAWVRSGASISREHRCATFMGAVQLIDRVAVAAEAADHHPDIDLRYTRVRFELTTHDSGGLTWRDLELAQAIDRLLVNGS